MSERVSVHIVDGVADVRLDRPDKMNALDAAMRKALNGTFPNLHDMQLVDYKVRVVNSEAATAAGVSPKTASLL